MKKNKCPVCGQHELITRQRDAIGEMNGIFFPYVEQYNYCTDEEEEAEDREFYTAKAKEANTFSKIEAYRKEKELLTSAEIAAFRNEYSLTQTSLSRIMGWPDNAVLDYETKTVQSEEENEALVSVIKDPSILLEKLEENKDKFGYYNYKELKAALKEIINSEEETA